MSVAKMSKVSIIGLRDKQIEIISYLANQGVLQIETDEELEADFKKIKQTSDKRQQFALSDLHYYAEIADDLKKDNLLKEHQNYLPDDSSSAAALADWSEREDFSSSNKNEELRKYFFDRMYTFALADTSIIDSSKQLDADEVQALKSGSANFNLEIESESLLNLSRNYMNFLDELIPKAKEISTIESETKASKLDVSNDDYLKAAYKQSEIIDEAIGLYRKLDKVEQIELNIRDIEERIQELGGQQASNYDPKTGEFSVPEEEFTEVDRLYKRIQEERAEIENLKEASHENADHYKDFEILHDFYEIQLAKLEAMQNLSYTDYVFALKAYIPTAIVDDFVDDLSQRYSVACNIEETAADEDYPVKLQNKKLTRPFEAVIEMYAMPRPGYDNDPSFPTAIFYSIVFGMMLGDVGYGALLVIACAIGLYVLKVQGNAKKLMGMLMISGIISIPFGFLFGGFFGDMVTRLSGGSYSFNALWFNPLDEPIKMLIFSIAVGMVHLFSGMGIDIYLKIKRGDWKTAVFQVAPWYLIVPGILLIILGYKIGTWMTIIGVAVIVLLSDHTKKNIFKRILGGLGNLLDITDWLSDLLSYSRILALSLSTAVIAMVVNILAKLVGYKGWQVIFFIMIMVVGHVINLLISGLSAYVHTIRLQYVEFYGKFYTGGGREFKPLNYESKYTRVAEVEDKQDEIVAGEFPRVKAEFAPVTTEELETV